MIKKKPNIIILNPDQMRMDSLHHMENEASVTPNFDRMVREDSISFVKILYVYRVDAVF